MRFDGAAPGLHFRGACADSLSYSLSASWRRPVSRWRRPFPAEVFEPVARTAHAAYYAAGGHGIDVRRSEAYLGQLVSLFGPAPAGWRIEYYRHASSTALRDRVGLEASGVTDLATGRIDSVRDFHPHELVHAVAGRIGRPPVFFAEGLAVALTGAGRWHGRDLDAVARQALAASPSLEPFLTHFTEQDPDTAYAVAGSLDRLPARPLRHRADGGLLPRVRFLSARL